MGSDVPRGTNHFAITGENATQATHRLPWPLETSAALSPSVLQDVHVTVSWKTAPAKVIAVAGRRADGIRREGQGGTTISEVRNYCSMVRSQRQTCCRNTGWPRKRHPWPGYDW